MRADMEFANQLSEIKNAEIRNFVRKVFEYVPDKFWYLPASSTSKYHPRQSNGHAGLIHHTKACFLIARDIIRSGFHSLSDDEKDVILAACLLHDTWKYPNASNFTLKYHAKKAFDEIERLFQNDDAIYSKPWFHGILACILAHNGCITPEFTGELSTAQLIVHVSDYLSSRRYCDINIGAAYE